MSVKYSYVQQFQPKLREEARLEIRSALDGTISNLMNNRLHHPYKTCLNCDHFLEEKELCRISTPMQRPPARIIAFGCQFHEDKDEIPF